MFRRIIKDHGRKLLRYAGVSFLGVTTGQLLLYLFYVVFELHHVVANTLAVAIATIPSYLLNRAWVWGKSGGHSAKSEVLPFWALAFISLVLSNLLVHLAENQWSSWAGIQAANLSAFGLVWTAKYVVLDRILFRDESAICIVDEIETVKD